MMFVIELALAFLGGLVLFALLPVLTLGRLSEWFVELAMASVERAILIKRSNAGFTLKASRYNPNYGTERVTAGGKTYDFTDQSNLMSRFKNRPFGLAHEDRGALINPRIADFGRELHEQKRDGDWTDAAGNRRKYFGFERGRALVNLDHALYAIQGSASPTLGDTTETYVEKGQAAFDSGRAVTYIIWLMMFGAGAGAPWILLKLSSSVDGGASLPGIPAGIAHVADLVGVLA
jgi:hypothetical protein